MTIKGGEKERTKEGKEREREGKERGKQGGERREKEIKREEATKTFSKNSENIFN